MVTISIGGNGCGSVAGLTGNSGGSMITYRYDAYGNTTKSNNTLNNPYQYNAEYTDSSTELQYLRARYYDSSQGRFTTKDTLLGSTEKPITRNLYTYCGNNPLNITDPSGHGWFKNAVNSVKRTANKVVNTVKRGYNTAKNWANTHIVQPVKSFISNTKQAASNAYNRGKSYVQQKYNQAKQSYNNAKTWVSNKWNNFKSDVSAKTQKAIDEVKRFVCTTKDRIVKDAKEFVSNVDWDKVAKGVMTAVAATAVVAVGVVAIAATGGAAAPAIAALAAGTATTFDVITVGTLAAGVTATAFGAADAFEAGQDLASGFAGDSDYVSFNPIRDTVFKNEPELYYLAETVVTYGAGAGTQMVNSMKVQDTPSNGQSSNNNNSLYKTEPQKLTESGKTPAIGKMQDLNQPGAVNDGEFKIADYLPDQGNPKANWKQNDGILRSVMNENQPIKDVSPYPMDNAGFLGAERNRLSSEGWTYQNGYWYPPSK